MGGVQFKDVNSQSCCQHVGTFYLLKHENLLAKRVQGSCNTDMVHWLWYLFLFCLCKTLWFLLCSYQASITFITPLFHGLPEITLCEEAIFQFLASPPLASFPVERLSESLPGRKVDWKSVERLKKSCSPQQQALHLLRLWREQNKDQDKLLSIIRGQFVLYRFNRHLEIKKKKKRNWI